ncbi:hypothetical protein TRICI_002290 [Trichomonascus ciferrii]|uniref:Centromere DNA-binding protein complex CBF3 subunit B C-terminal domain-containing protein n=1 Tax=Trichomonascus ciferrii TaxID=44093 RepID=A0A642VBT8_9ASCO|nr:hypothetical protein TRICI_002290 [Trichomonascus ciferrii]
MAGECSREDVIVKNTALNRNDLSARKRQRVDSPGVLNEQAMDSYNASIQFLSQGYVSLESYLLTKGQETEHNWIKYSKDLEKVLGKLTKELSESIVSFSCKNLSFIHNGISSTLFLEEHNAFWEDQIPSDIQCINYLLPSGFQEQTPRDYYFWMALYYAVLCTGVYFGHDQLKIYSTFSDTEAENIPSVLFRASYDCLHRADFMNFPDLRTVQVYCILSTCFHSFAGVHLHNCLLNSVIYTARYLRLDRIPNNTGETLEYEKEVSKRLWFTLCVIDWMSNFGRPSSISVGEFSTPYPQLLTDSQLYQMATSNISVKSISFVPAGNSYSNILYQHYMIELAKIKREYYFDNATKSSLHSADVELEKLMNRYENEFCNIVHHPVDEVSVDVHTFEFSRYLLYSSLESEILEISRRYLSVVGKDMWEKCFRQRTIDKSLKVLRHLREYPTHFNRMWFIMNHVTSAAMFLLLDILMFKETGSVVEARMAIIKDYLPLMKQNTHLQAKVGFVLLDRLMYIVECTYSGGVFSEDRSSLKRFLDDLNVAPGPASVPIYDKSINKPIKSRRQYFRPPIENCNESTTDITGNSDGLNFDEMLSDSGWLEFLSWLSSDFNSN